MPDWKTLIRAAVSATLDDGEFLIYRNGPVVALRTAIDRANRCFRRQRCGRPPHGRLARAVGSSFRTTRPAASVIASRSCLISVADPVFESWFCVVRFSVLHRCLGKTRSRDPNRS